MVMLHFVALCLLIFFPLAKHTFSLLTEKYWPNREGSVCIASNTSIVLRIRT
jgi:hypothetical protein